MILSYEKGMDLINEIKAITNEKNIKVNELMSKHTSFKTGGPADIFVTPETKEELINLLKLDVDKTIIGSGSNILVKDGGIRGLVIKINTNNFKIEDDVIYADAGCALPRLSRVAMENSLSGLEFACGIPGTLGGAIYMNAGAYGGEMKDVVVETEALDRDGRIHIIKDHEFGYRNSCFQNNELIIISSKLQLQHGDKSAIKEKMDENMNARKQKQPIDKPNAGSTFKRPKDNFAAKLIQDAGLKGYSIGDAQVSELHAGFIINKGKATSKDILLLMKYVKEKVNAEYGVMLEPEIKILGED